MMRYQTDCIPLTNGGNAKKSDTDTVESKGLRFRYPSRILDHHPNRSSEASRNHYAHAIRGGSGDVLLQWGQKKRARFSRSEIRSSLVEESSSWAASAQCRQSRRMEMKAAPSAPAPAPSSRQQQLNGFLGKEKPGVDAYSNRNVEKLSAGGSGSPSRNNAGASNRLPSRSAGKRSPDRFDRKMASPKHHDGSQPAATATADQADSQALAATITNSNTNTSNNGGVQKLASNGQAVIEWPRIYLALSRKEKEEDFFAMKGTKLPQRPKKRPKNVDKTLQYCFPGMWLSDLTKSRYEVREKKSVKKQKRRRGLKGMESMESESD
ncbi:hypothetical protein K2173_025093 [Erythroxylum novogranatense]|uniref:DUF1639 family protein n=1 Tax=Erythroxylum novogranatense TaxID=1862640 RepID=A0AAV8SVG8_9ROSI|nr:hypothetical protein K2173_025093 [Erythroxylum novogranatense]